MKTTGNYALKKPDGTDIVNIDDLNGNMDIVDTQLKNAANHSADGVRHITAAERTAWNAKPGGAVATTSANGLMAAADKVKLNEISPGANNYAHPSAHPASMITGLPTSLPANGGNSATVNGHTVNSNVPAGAKFTDTVYTHPSTHPASMITQDATHRFVTDAEKAAIQNRDKGIKQLWSGSSYTSVTFNLPVSIINGRMSVYMLINGYHDSPNNKEVAYSNDARTLYGSPNRSFLIGINSGDFPAYYSYMHNNGNITISKEGNGKESYNISVSVMNQGSYIVCTVYPGSSFISQNNAIDGSGYLHITDVSIII